MIANDLGERTTPCMIGYDGEEVVRVFDLAISSLFFLPISRFLKKERGLFF